MTPITVSDLRKQEPGCRITVPTVYATGAVVGRFLGILPGNDQARKARERHDAIIVRNGDLLSHVRLNELPKPGGIRIDKRTVKRRGR
jgi:hypothetical protein